MKASGMTPTRLADKHVFMCLVLVITFLALVFCSPTAILEESEPDLENQLQQHQEEQAGPMFPALLDFEKYQRLFNKHYGSSLEKIRRHIFFMAKAFAAYASDVAYRLWQRSYYLAVNEFSDMSPEELTMMKNKYLAEGPQGQEDPEAIIGKMDPLNDSDSAKLAQVAEVEIEEALEESQSEFDDSEENKSTTTPSRSQYDLTVSDGILRGIFNEDHNDITIWKSPVASSESQEETVEADVDADATNPSLGPQNSYLAIGNEQSAKTQAEMFVDLRDTGCFSEPRQQGLCGSCYVFASISIMEYLICKKTGQLVRLSEQPLIDCGKEFVEGMYGCNGGKGFSVARFVKNFGLELWQNYKYYGYELKCPLKNDTQLISTGFYRLELNDIKEIPVEQWPEMLQFGPLYVGLAAGDDWAQYGGGVYDGKNCAEKENHSVVLVGHGRERGQEFWLLRNSHGPNWGAEGYFKLAKSAPKRCIGQQLGYALGTADGVNYVEPRQNDRYAKISLF